VLLFVSTVTQHPSTSPADCFLPTDSPSEAAAAPVESPGGDSMRHGTYEQQHLVDWEGAFMYNPPVHPTNHW